MPVLEILEIKDKLSMNEIMSLQVTLLKVTSFWKDIYFNLPFLQDGITKEDVMALTSEVEIIKKT